MSETTRTFFAIEIPEPLETELRRLQRILAPELPACRFTRDSTPFHMTLAFLGNVGDADSTLLHDLVVASVAGFQPCELQFQGLGTFPSARRPRVLWAGLRATDTALLEQIQQAVSGAAKKAGYPADDRFHPHVTLGRFKPDRRGPCDATAVMERYRSWSCGVFTATEVVGFASRITREAPSYEPQSRAPLAGAKSKPLP